MNVNGRVARLEALMSKRSQWGLSPETLRYIEVEVALGYGAAEGDLPSPSELAELEARAYEQDADFWRWMDCQLKRIYGEVQDV